MKRYNYYTVKGREEIIKEENDWYNAEEVDKERANDKKEVEQLRKEKEWMLDVLAEHYIDEVDPYVTECEARDGIVKEMHKALKEPLEIITGPAPPEAKELKRCKRYFNK